MDTMGPAEAKTQLLPPKDDVEIDPIFGLPKGQLEIVGDIVSPTFTDEEYEEFFQASEAQLTLPSDSQQMTTPPGDEAQS